MGIFTTRWESNMAMENTRTEWRFVARKITYFYGPFSSKACLMTPEGNIRYSPLLATITLWQLNIVIQNGPFIVDFPIEHGGFPLRKLLVINYQGVNHIKPL